MEMLNHNFDGLINDALEEIADISSVIIDEDGEAELRLTLEQLAKRVFEHTLDDLDPVQRFFM